MSSLTSPNSPNTISGNPWDHTLSARDESRANDRLIFSSVLSRAKQDATTDPAQAAAEGAENLVSVALVQPILSKMRESTWAVEPFKATSGQKSFNTMMDNAMSLKLVRSGNWPLVDKVKERLLAKLHASETADTQTDISTLTDGAGPDLARQALGTRPNLNFNAPSR